MVTDLKTYENIWRFLNEKLSLGWSGGQRGKLVLHHESMFVITSCTRNHPLRYRETRPTICVRGHRRWCSCQWCQQPAGRDVGGRQGMTLEQCASPWTLHGTWWCWWTTHWHGVLLSPGSPTPCVESKSGVPAIISWGYTGVSYEEESVMAMFHNHFFMSKIQSSYTSFYISFHTSTHLTAITATLVFRILYSSLFYNVSMSNNLCEYDHFNCLAQFHLATEAEGGKRINIPS